MLQSVLSHSPVCQYTISIEQLSMDFYTSNSVENLALFDFITGDYGLPVKDLAIMTCSINYLPITSLLLSIPETL